MKQFSNKVNFIKHFLEVNELFQADEKITPFHISLYLSLFLEWNHANFKNPISISRTEMMRISKIGSSNTYTKILKELHELKYIEYFPSFNRYTGSKVLLFIFDNSSDKGSDKASDNGSDKASEMQVRPYLNYNKLNKLNKLNKTKETNKHIKLSYEKKSKKQNEDNQNVLFIEKESVPKKILHSFPTSLEEVQSYFLEKKYTSSEAEKFFNYFESNGWLVGGRAKMKNWKAAANNWILNSKKFNPEEKENHYHTNENKDYNIPL